MGTQTGSVAWEICGSQDGYRIYSRKREEFIADFCLISQRTLDDFEYKLLRYHYLLGGDCNLCCQHFQMDRGAYFHSIYRIENNLGRVFAEVKPYALYPINEYFAGTTRREGRKGPATELNLYGCDEPEDLPLSA
jgi:hypothetical protein